MKPRFIDLFAGIGGMRIGFSRAGAECVLTCEINEAALTTYRANFTPASSHSYHKDILTLEPEKIPDHDIMVAGFPCQPYSIAGLRKGLMDERGGNVFIAIIKILKIKRPKAFLLENVKGMLNHDKGETFKFIIASLEDCGYRTKYQVLNSKDHANIPQNRERVFLVGFLNDNHFKNFEFPKEIALTNTIHSCLENRKVDDFFYYDDRFECFKIIQKEVISKDTIYQWRRLYVRENKSNACPTLTANMGLGGHNVPLIKDAYGIRKLTPRETANFQGFPKDFVLPRLPNNKLYHQFGNSVTVPLIEKIARKIVLAID
jgi:DNA (cytosine-5)-methyltransferase 1